MRQESAINVIQKQGVNFHLPTNINEEICDIVIRRMSELHPRTKFNSVRLSSHSSEHQHCDECGNKIWRVDINKAQLLGEIDLFRICGSCHTVYHPTGSIAASFRTFE